MKKGVSNRKERGKGRGEGGDAFDLEKSKFIVS